MEKLRTVSIGIVAYNEEKNIKNVLHDILNQKRKTWKLDKIYVSCGGCTDRTVKFARSIDSPYIKVFDNPKRQGKAVDEQKIFETLESDFLVMLDADVRLYGNDVIENLLDKFNENKNIFLVGGNPRPYKPITFFERAVYSTFKVLDKSRHAIKNGNNIYGCSGQCLAMKKKLVKEIKFAKGVIAEDDFIYFTCISKGWLFRYCKESVVYYKLPKKLGDYIRQIFRADPDAVNANVEKHFGKLVRKEYHRPFRFYFKALISAFLENPLGTSLMILIRLISKPLVPLVASKYKLSWYTAASTK